MDDLAAAVAFFRDTLGLEQVAAFENDGGHAVLLDAGHATLELFDRTQARAVDDIEVGRRVAGKVRGAFQASDSDTARRKLANVGAENRCCPATPARRARATAV